MTAGQKIWFITGTSRGFGRIWAEAALERGDLVAATARNVGTLVDLQAAHPETLLALSLDVTDRPGVDAAVAAAQKRFGHLDVVINNAGYGLFGTVEEVSEEQARSQIETNLLGALWVTKAVLPGMRRRGRGHILQVSSIGGVQAFPTLGLYHASKWGLEAFSQSLAGEVAGMGIHVTIVEPTGYDTDWSGDSAVHADPLDAYRPIHEQRAALVSKGRRRRGDPQATAEPMLELVDAPEPPLRVFLGEGPLTIIREEYRRRLAIWEQWNELSVRAHGGEPSGGGARIQTGFGFETTAAEAIEGIDLTGRRAIITGGASGIGVETARALAGAGAEVTLAVRDTIAGERTAAEIRAGVTDGEVSVAQLDLADLSSVERLCRSWEGPLHLLVNNAGVMALQQLTLSPDGHELQFATNHLGHFALALGLHDALAEAGGSRIVSLSSSAHHSSPVIFDDIDFAFREYGPFLAYGQSKTANVLFAVEASRRWAGDGITANAVMPGGIATNLQRHVGGREYMERRRAEMGASTLLKTVEQGAATSIVAATSPLLEGVGGRYFEDCNEAEVLQRRGEGDARLHGVAPFALDPANAARLWEVSLAMLGRD